MFETTVVESRKKRGGYNRFLTLPVSIAVHSVAFGAAVFATVWNVEFPTNPPAQVAQFMVVAPPPPPPPPPPRAAPPPEAKPIEAPKAIQEMAPQVVQDIVEPSPEGDSEGVEGGVAGGVAGGVVAEPVVAAPPAPEPDVPLRVGGAISAPVAIRRVNPTYTEIARKARVSGIVIVEAIIDREGRVKDAKILRGLPMGLDKAALDALKQWTFEPAKLNGKPVEVYYNLTINFQLTDRPR
jgi:protein TonB